MIFTVASPGGLEIQASSGNATLVASNAVRTTLRRITASAHGRLHAHPDFVGLQEGKLSRKDYAELLLRLLGLHAPIEEQLTRYDHDRVMAWRSSGSTPSRPTRLRMDLAYLGFGSASIAAAARADTLLPVIDCPAAALGCAWVVEGSSLGGAVLGQKLIAILGSTGAKHGGAFLSSIPEQADRWRGCCAAVELCGSDALGRTTLENASVATFDAFEAWFGKKPSCSDPQSPVD